ncbi:DNA-binding protein VF530 [Corallincola luteus]|uniref:DNA-binding protein VF530 n=1 Tax=Corallincola luteus TaxID=1775177 RepID=A0ABY2ANW6_9GAMM|nr:VF530 family DNA-binding protein [Corallincola luteus]TCI04712.1 DNA-binding protein VF530 [Corallincola luteus]
MSDNVNYTNNPLHGVGLKTLLTEIVDQYGFQLINAYLNINCFKTNPSIESCEKFLKKTEWARHKVEAFYLYEFKNLPRASDEQFALPPRERIVPEGQTPREPKALSFEDAQRMHERRAKRAEERRMERGSRAGGGRGRAQGRGGNARHSRGRDTEGRSSANESTTADGKYDPWANWKNKQK